MVLDGLARPLTEWLEVLERTPKIDFLIVDPARRFLKGDEDASGPADDFYAELHRFARLKNCAVLVLHHLTKGSPRSLANMLPKVRGSTVHTDRPRLIWGIRDLGNDIVEIGPINTNLDREEIDWPINSGRLFRRDPGTHILQPFGDRSEPTDRPMDATEGVLAAVKRLNAENSIVRRSGKSGLFELRLPEVAGLSRSAILGAIGNLVTQGGLTEGEGGLVATS